MQVEDTVSGENQRATGSQGKIAGTRSDPGDWNCLGLQDFQGAGDGTRTHDVQLGKEAEKQALSGVRANSPLRTRCSVRRSPGISRQFWHATGPALRNASTPRIAFSQ